MFFENFLNLIILILVFIIGSAFGSFLNVLIFRIHNNIDWFKKHSFCPNCGKNINWQDLIPIISFLILKGKCRFCKSKIPISYFFVEILSGFIFAFSYFFYYNNIFLFLLISFTFLFLLGLFVSDLKYLEFSNLLLYLLIILGFLYQFVNYKNFNEFIFDLKFWLGIIVPIIFFGLQFLITFGKGLGEGDIWLGFIMGLFLGFPNVIYAIMISYFIATLILLPLLFLKKINRKTAIPLGVFLIPVTALFLILKNFLNIDFSDFWFNFFYLNLLTF